MPTEIPCAEINELIGEMCESSRHFNGFYKNEILKLKGKPIRWIHDPTMKIGGLATPNFQTGITPSDYEIKLRIYPLDNKKVESFFIIAHELGHCIQYEQGCLLIRFHQNTLRKLGSASIFSAFNSMIYDYSVNLSLSRYGIEIPFVCNPIPYSEKCAENFFDRKYLGSLIFYILIKRSLNLDYHEKYTEKIWRCQESFDQGSLVNIVNFGNEIIALMEKCNITSSDGDINPYNIPFFIKELITRWNEKYPYRFTFSKTRDFIMISQEE